MSGNRIHPWNHVRQEVVLSWRNAHHDVGDPQAERDLARKLWRYHPAHWIRLGILAALAVALLVLAIDARDLSVLLVATLAVAIAIGLVPPLVLRATRSANRRRTAVLARDLLWTQRAVHLIDVQLAALRTPSIQSPRGDHCWSRMLAGVLGKLRIRPLRK